MMVRPPCSTAPFRGRSVTTHALTRCLAFAGCVLISFTAGCGKKPPEMGQVVGTVRVKGQPQARLFIRFLPEPGKDNNLPISSTGKTDAQGKYSLQHVYKDKSEAGAPVGSHRVVIEDNSRGPAPQGQTPPPPLIPLEYSSPTSTPLHVEVKAGEQTIDLDVK